MQKPWSRDPEKSSAKKIGERARSFRETALARGEGVGVGREEGLGRAGDDGKVEACLQLRFQGHPRV